MKDKLERLQKYVFYFLPNIVKDTIIKKKQEQDLKKAQDRAKRVKISKEEVSQIIQNIDIGDCDVFLHSSTMNIGKIQGGVKWVTKCLLDKADISKNTILVSALPYRGKFKDYLEKGLVFDVRSAPIAMGGINEHIGSLSEAKRSIHPTHSVVAIGKNAKDYVSGHHLDKTPFDVNSPYYKIIKNHGKALMFGASINYLTCIHAVEDMLGNSYPGKIYASKRYKVKCLNAEGKELVVETPYHAPLQSCIRMMMPLKPQLMKCGIMEIIPIGESEIEMIDLYRFAIFYLNEIREGRTIYGRVKVSSELKLKIDTIINTL